MEIKCRQTLPIRTRLLRHRYRVSEDVCLSICDIVTEQTGPRSYFHGRKESRPVIRSSRIEQARRRRRDWGDQYCRTDAFRHFAHDTIFRATFSGARGRRRYKLRLSLRQGSDAADRRGA